MKTVARWTILTSAVLVLSVPLLLAAGDAEAGATFFGKKCATCHGKAGEGKAAIAKMMKVEMHHLGSKEVQAKSDAEMKKIILEGTGKMKPVKGLSDADVANVIAFVRTLKE